MSQVYPGDDMASLELQFLSRISEAFELPDQNLKELRPDGLERIVIDKESQHPEVLRAVKKAWYMSRILDTMMMPLQVEKIMLARGFKEEEAQGISRRFI